MEPDRPQITPAHLRRGDDLCRRRLAHELRGGKRHANKTADARFAVSNRLDADARLAHAEVGALRPEAFVDPVDLEPEQRALYRAAARGYRALFADDAVKAVDLGWRTTVPDLDVDIVANIGLAVEHVDGARELRMLRVGRPASSELIDAVDVHVALVRTEEWAPDDLRIVAADVIDLRAKPVAPVLPRDREIAREAIARRVPRLLELAADPRPHAGADCRGCAFVSGCAKHAEP